ncbi:MAG: DUF47 family protein [Parcubacteria group bacterium]
MAFGSSRDTQIKRLLLELARDTIVPCAAILEEFFQDGASREILLGRIIEFEHAGDRIVGEVHTLIDQSFITWIDKRDVTTLLDALDDILGRMREAVELADAYRFESAVPEAQQLAAIIREMVKHLPLMVRELEKPKIEPLAEPAAALQRMEHEADKIRMAALRQLYPQGHPGFVRCGDRILWLLEQTTDECNHAAKVMVSIAQKAG